MSPWQRFSLDYKQGCGTDQCKRAAHVVLARGSVPADVVFVGEAPGESEDALGLPFVGPAGKLQDRIVKKALAGACICSHETCGKSFFASAASSIHTNEMDEPTYCPSCGRQQMPKAPRVAFCNLVGCIPRDGSGNKIAEPEHDQIQACTPRLERFLELCQPRLVVCVGKLSTEWLKQGFKLSVKVPKSAKIISTIHPAGILRAEPVRQGLLEQKAVVTIRTAFAELGE